MTLAAWIRLLVVLLFTPCLLAQSIKVFSKPNQLAAKANQTATITVEIDIPTTRSRNPETDPGNPDFDIQVSSGLLRDPATGGWSPNVNVRIPRSADGLQAKQVVRLEYSTPDQPQPGEVVISVEGSQGVRLQGLPMAGMAIYRGLGRLYLTGDTDVQRPPTRPPFQATEQPVDSNREMANRAILLAALLGTIAGVRFAVTRSGKNQPKPSSTPERKPALAPPPPPKGTLQTDGRGRPKPKSAVQVTLSASRYEADGDGQSTITLILDVKMVDGAAGISYSVRSVSYSAARPDYTFAPEGQNATATMAWEWQTIERMEFKATVRIRLTSSGGPLATGGKSTDVTLTAICPIRVNGANPTFVVEPKSEVAYATGTDDVELAVDLWLFDRPIEPQTEEVHVDNPSALLAGVACGNWSGLIPGPCPTIHWRLPVLVQEPGYGETVTFSLQCSWIGGDIFKRVRKPIPASPVATCEITVFGCHLDMKLPSGPFVPLPGCEFFGSGRLLDARGNTIGRFLDHDVTLGPKAGVTLEVYDLSQGQPTRPSDCKIPPKLVFDEYLNEARQAGNLTGEERVKALDAIIDRILAGSKPVYRAPVTVGPYGVFLTLGENDRYLAWEYALKPGCEPIHGGPVVFRFVFDDGFDGKQEVRSLSTAALGTLVLETGGPEFRIAEGDPFCFQVTCKAPTADYTLPPKVRMLWHFAAVDSEGKPVAPAGQAEVDREMVPGKYNSYFILGHTSADCLFFRGIIQDNLGEVRRFQKETFRVTARQALSLDWVEITEEDRKASLKIRKAIHDVPKQHWLKDEPAFGFLPDEASLWNDSLVPLAVRIEMRTPEGYLIATSDRSDDFGGRTAPQWVWRDHRFLYVLQKLRLRLCDALNYPLKDRSCKLTGESFEVTDNTGPDARLEKLLPPHLDRVKLEILDSKGQPEYSCGVDLRLGSLETIEVESGQASRIDNLQLFSGSIDGDSTTEPFQRAVQRFHYLVGFKPQRTLDKDVRKRLDDVHAWQKLSRKN